MRDTFACVTTMKISATASRPRIATTVIDSNRAKPAVSACTFRPVRGVSKPTFLLHRPIVFGTENIDVVDVFIFVFATFFTVSASVYGGPLDLFAYISTDRRIGRTTCRCVWARAIYV